jgi:RNA polymerase sigma-70 factor (ECF subfamily)
LRLRDARDAAAWAQFVEIYTPLVFTFCRQRGLQEADAADVAQEVMRAVARAMERFDYRPEQGTFRAWLFTVTRNKFNNFLEGRRRHPQGTGETAVQEFLEAQPCPERDESWDREYHQRLFEWACGQVRRDFEEPTWNAFWQTAVEEKSGKEVAAALGLSVGAVYIARSRVTARIREAVRQLDDEQAPFNQES